MKALFLQIFLCCSVHAAVTMNMSFGTAFDNQGVAVSDGMLWVLVADDGDSKFQGFGVGSSLIDPSGFSTGSEISIGGTIGSDTIFAMGEFNGSATEVDGFVSFADSFEIGVNGVVSGNAFAFYYFPDVEFTGDTAITGSQVGGIHANSDATSQADGMYIPGEGSTSSPGAVSSSAGGSIPDSNFTAVAIPEPSAALLGGLGALVLLRRRRN